MAGAAVGDLVSEHRHRWEPGVAAGWQKCANAKYGGCDIPERKIPTTPAPAQEHSETSKAAARSITTFRHRDRVRVYQAFQAAGFTGLTDEELIATTGLPANTARPRRIDLVKENLVVDSSRTRPTRSGRSASVWVTYDALYGAEAQALGLEQPADTTPVVHTALHEVAK